MNKKNKNEKNTLICEVDINELRRAYEKGRKMVEAMVVKSVNYSASNYKSLKNVKNLKGYICS